MNRHIALPQKTTRPAFATSKRNCRFSREFSLQNEDDFKCLFGAGKREATCRQLRGMDIK